VTTERGASRGRQLAAIAAFWAVFGALSVTNWIFPPGNFAPPITARAIGVGLFEALLWAIATPPIFWLTSRFSVERGERFARIVLYLAVGVWIALSIDLLVELVRTTYLAPPPRPGGGPPRQRSVWAFARIRFLNDYMIYLAVLGAGVARDYFLRYHRRLEEAASLRAQLAEARLTVLQSQLNPHFLFNTLNAVSALVERDPRGVRTMLARLSELLRATLEPSADPEVPLAREIALLERYLDILRIRFQGKLDTAIDVPEGIRDALVPPLILQPLVENAMKHAVSKTAGRSRIAVTAERSGDTLVLAVRDSGAGDAAREEPAPPLGDRGGADGNGIGLANTRARLAQLYGATDAVALVPLADGGTIVTIRLPYHTAAERRIVPLHTGGA
jgi:signal transduction histidine kinase